jgi:valyl-tRNA synthetase
MSEMTAPPTGARVPEKPALEGLEAKWSQRWEAEGVYRFDRSSPRERIYSIDTPPPTVSGSLHVGHVFSYTHTDLIARYQRMRGQAVFYPMGWDDNGLPTERRVQNYYGVRCDTSLPFDPAFNPSDEPVKSGTPVKSVSRPNFVALCERLTVKDEQAFEALWRQLGLSVDWSMTYATISRASQRVSQLAFLNLLRKDRAYQLEAPTLWDVDFRTAVAQAELEDREQPGAYHKLRFARDGGAVEIETTRPELLPACVALVAHPDDERYKPLFGTQVRTPLFQAPVPILAHPLASPEKGTGVAMICTFGDLTDVTWWRELSLPVRAIVQPNGTLRPVAWGTPGWESNDAAAAQAAYDQLASLSVTKARTKIVELLKASGELLGEPRPITHAVKFYEKGDRPLEIVTSRQWFIRTLPFRERLLERGRELQWHPPYMRARFENWVAGLNGDWCVSRQRFFGVPFPVWYRLDASAQADYAHPILPDDARLPIDPSSDVPHGYTAAQRGQPNGFIGDPDIMDTWATSSLTPQIVSGWGVDPALFDKVFPLSLRPQAHDIIRTWLFSTVLRAELEHDSLPWAHAAISGWVLDPDRKKMSKSKGNVVTPAGLLDEHGSDAVRYWAASGGPGVDTAFDPAQMKVGRRLAIKLLNASKFILAGDADLAAAAGRPVTAALDRGMLTNLAALVAEVTEALDDYDYAKALQRTEAFFWDFCDNYVELVKARRYGDARLGAQVAEGQASAQAALQVALEVLLRLFAPYLPYAAEEVWSWWREGSVHRAAWPTPAEVLRPLGGAADSEAQRAYERAQALSAEVRRQKAAQKVSQKTRVTSLTWTVPSDWMSEIRAIEGDAMAALGIDALALAEGPSGEVALTLERPPDAAPGAPA